MVNIFWVKMFPLKVRKWPDIPCFWGLQSGDWNLSKNYSRSLASIRYKNDMLAFEIIWTISFAKQLRPANHGMGLVAALTSPPPPTKKKIRGQRLNTHSFFVELFGHRRDIPAKSRDIPPKKFDFPGLEGHTEFFGPHPFMWKTPPPPENFRTQKFGFGFLFRARKLCRCLSFSAPWPACAQGVLIQGAHYRH